LFDLDAVSVQHLERLPLETLAIVTETTTFNPVTGMNETATTTTNFQGHLGNFSLQGMSAINATRTEGNYITEQTWRIITTSDIAMTAKIRINSDDYKIIYKKESKGYFVYGVVLWGS